MKLIDVFLSLMQITLLDLALCADNIGVIALATRNLSEKSAKHASFLGISGAIILRIYFATCISFFLRVQWIPVKLIGGIILLKITWDLIKTRPPKQEIHINSSGRFWDAVITVLIADVSMSLDNVLAIAGASNGNIMLIFFGILFNIPIIFLGSQFVMNLMKKNSLIVYISGAILGYTSIKMIFEDYWFNKLVTLSPLENTLISIMFAGVIFLYCITVLNDHTNQHFHQKKRKAS